MDGALERVERRYVLMALALVAAVVATLATVDLWLDAARPTSTRADLMSRCLAEEKFLPVLDLPVGSFLGEAEHGGVRVIVETTNRVSVGIAGSEEEAASLEREALRRTQSRRRVERRQTIVLVWRNPPSATQRQAIYDCSY
jgi:hypothetical protein